MMRSNFRAASASSPSVVVVAVWRKWLADGAIWPRRVVVEGWLVISKRLCWRGMVGVREDGHGGGRRRQIGH